MTDENFAKIEAAFPRCAFRRHENYAICSIVSFDFAGAWMSRSPAAPEVCSFSLDECIDEQKAALTALQERLNAALGRHDP